MKVVLKRTQRYELEVDSYTNFPDILDVLADDSADEEEKAKTIIYSLEGDYGVPLVDSFKVLVYTTNEDIIFTGSVTI